MNRQFLNDGAPPDVPPATLYRRLTRAPWPRLVLQHPLSRGGLFARALAGRDLAELLEAEQPDAGMLAACIVDQYDRPVFDSAAQASQVLTEPEATSLVYEVLDALSSISPTYSRSNVRAWHHVLMRGAKDPANIHDAMALGECLDSGAQHIVLRPDRYFGRAVGALVDGQWMAIRAARAVLSEMK